MSEYTQEDFLPKVRQDSAGNVWFDEPAKKRVTLLSDAKSVAQVIPILMDAYIAQVRAEARQAPNLSERECQVCGEKLPKASSFSVHNGKCRRTGARLAAAKTLAEAVVAYSVALTRERSFDPETKYQRERAWTLVEDSLNAFREAAK